MDKFIHLPSYTIPVENINFIDWKWKTGIDGETMTFVSLLGDSKARCFAIKPNSEDWVALRRYFGLPVE